MISIGIKKNFNILCLGAHPDDIEIGCGGTILKLLEEFNNITINWVVFSAKDERKDEAIEGFKSFTLNAKNKEYVIKNFKESCFPYIGTSIKDYFEEMKNIFSPDIIFTHNKNDAHQDHALISDLTWNTFRNHLILEYEIPKYDGDFGSPNFFVNLSKTICNQKISEIIRIFSTQKPKQWFSEDTFWSTLRLRGIESNSPSKYSEAFYCRKIII